MDNIHGGDIYTYQGMLDFSANISPLGPDPRVIEAMKESLAKIGTYPDVNCTKLREAIGKREQVAPEHILCGNGAADLIFSIALALKPKKALLLAPSFAEYAQALQTVDCEITYHHLKEEQGFRLTRDLFSHLKKELDIIFICSPNNPTGSLVEQKLLEELLEYCEKQKVILVVDECFLDFLEQPEKSTMKSFLQSKVLLILKAFTKMYALPGVRLGYAMAGDSTILKRIEAVRQPWSVSVVAQAGGIKALEDENWPKQVRTYIQEERKYLCQQFQILGVTYYEPAANYIFLKSEQDLFTCLKEKQILIRDCGNYEGLEKGYYRIAVRTHEENQRLIQGLGEIYQRGVTNRWQKQL
ncbi:MAG: aminotransferase class I/II-fold pyridoxal phosphate-dependent enzyme [Lachnospiraceae bacterium]